MMFAMQDDFADGAPYDRAYAEERQKWERIFEVTQLKGDGEAHPLLSPEDEFADMGLHWSPVPRTHVVSRRSARLASSDTNRRMRRCKPL